MKQNSIINEMNVLDDQHNIYAEYFINYLHVLKCKRHIKVNDIDIDWSHSTEILSNTF